jgi:lipoprotein-anchoring transpeptidase ErfK/SrfK
LRRTVSLQRHAAALVVTGALVVGCTGDGSPQSGPTPQRAPQAGAPTTGGPTTAGSARPADPAGRLRARYGEFPHFAATARVDKVVVYDARRGKSVRTLRHPQPSGAPLTFLVEDVRAGWLRVQLPVRPNGSTGWVRAADVAVAGVNYRVDVHLRSHRLELFERGKRVATFPVGVGTRNTPTPGGTFYLKELLKPTNKGGFYGPYAYGLSGFSNVLNRFGAKGEGVIGLHGTNDESTIGRDVSAGCIRMRNKDITRLARTLPLGTPVRILT